MPHQTTTPDPVLEPSAREPSTHASNPGSALAGRLPQQAVWHGADLSAGCLDHYYDPHCEMSRRDIEQGLALHPRALVQDLVTFDREEVIRALPLDADVLRGVELDNFPEQTAAIAMIWGRERMMRRTESVLRELELPRPDDSSILQWQPGAHILGTEPMPLRWRLIREAMLTFNTFPWVKVHGVNRGFIRPELYVIESLHISTLEMRQITALLKRLAECYPQRYPVDDECTYDSWGCFNGCRICLGRHWKIPGYFFPHERKY